MSSADGAYIIPCTRQGDPSSSMLVPPLKSLLLRAHTSAKQINRNGFKIAEFTEHNESSFPKHVESFFRRQQQ